MEENSGNSDHGIEASTAELPKRKLRDTLSIGTRKQCNKHHRDTNEIGRAIQNFPLLYKEVLCGHIASTIVQFDTL